MKTKKEYNKEYYLKNKHKEKTEEQIEYARKKAKEWDLKNKDKKIEYQKEWYKKNKERISANQRIYEKERLKNDIVFKLKKSLTNSISKIFKTNNYTKKSRTFEILGCSYDEFLIYLESKFEPWMNWDNKGLYNGELNYGWDIDHIIPTSSATTEEELINLCHYSNLQPLCSKINRDIKKASLNTLFTI